MSEIEQDTCDGWKEIADAIDVSVRAAQERAGRGYDPLPVRVGHRGPWAYRSALRDWVMRQDMAYSVSLRVRDGARRDLSPRAPRKST